MTQPINRNKGACLLSIYFIFFICCSTNRRTLYELLDNKTVVYSGFKKAVDSIYNYSYNAFFIDYRDRAQYWVKDSLGYLDIKIVTDTLRNDPLTVRVRDVGDAPRTYFPKRFKRVGKKIYLSYSVGGSNIENLQYSLKKHDTTSVIMTDFYCYDTKRIQKGVGIFTGKDTSIYLNNLQFKCWVFEEYYVQALPAPAIKRIVYLHVDTFLPILIWHGFYENKEFLRILRPPTYYTLSFWVDNKNYKDPFWRLPDCNFR